MAIVTFKNFPDVQNDTLATAMKEAAEKEANSIEKLVSEREELEKTIKEAIGVEMDRIAQIDKQLDEHKQRLRDVQAMYPQEGLAFRKGRLHVSIGKTTPKMVFDKNALQNNPKWLEFLRKKKLTVETAHEGRYEVALSKGRITEEEHAKLQEDGCIKVQTRKASVSIKLKD